MLVAAQQSEVSVKKVSPILGPSFSSSSYKDNRVHIADRHNGGMKKGISSEQFPVCSKVNQGFSSQTFLHRDGSNGSNISKSRMQVHLKSFWIFFKLISNLIYSLGFIKNKIGKEIIIPNVLILHVFYLNMYVNLVILFTNENNVWRMLWSQKSL